MTEANEPTPIYWLGPDGMYAMESGKAARKISEPATSQFTWQGMTITRRKRPPRNPLTKHTAQIEVVTHGPYHVIITHGIYTIH